MRKFCTVISILPFIIIAMSIICLFAAWELCKLNLHPIEGAYQRVNKLSHRQTFLWFTGVGLLLFSFLMAVV